MFLNSLSSNEKNNFMKLAIAVIKADGVIENNEKQVLTAYANEMQIGIEDTDVQYDIDHIIESLSKESTDQSKRVIFVELLALAFADGNYTDEEKNIIQKLAKSFNLGEDFIERAINLQDSYIAAYMSLVNLIEKGE